MKLRSLQSAIEEFVPDGSSIAMGLQMEQMIPLAAGHEIIRERTRAVRRWDGGGSAHCWGRFGVMIEGGRSAKRVIVCAEEIVAPEVLSSDPNRTVIPGFLVSAVCHVPLGAHPSPVQGYYKRDDAFFRQYHEESKTAEAFESWANRWVFGVRDTAEYGKQLGQERVASLGVKQHAYAAQTDYGY